LSIVVQRVTSAEDLGGLLAVEHASFMNPWTREMYLAELQNPGVSHLLVAKDPSGQVVGFCGFWCVVDELHINNLAVLPEYRRQGIASMILSRVFAEGRHVGAARATLEVRRSNEIARRLYERFGFTVAGVRRGYYRQPDEDALILWRDGLPDDSENGT
jgi:[ribosomal protein S18]-alanine N-acetyltransferase